MSFKLDASRPTVVVVGAWNAAILKDPTWVTRYVLGLQPGVEIEGKKHVSVEKNGAQKEIYEFADLIWSVSGARLEFFRGNAKHNEKICAAIENLAITLPHTPILAVGVNFSYVNETPSQGELEAIRNFDELSDLGRVQAISCTDTIEMPPESKPERENGFVEQVVLKVERGSNLEKLEFNFNFHCELGGASDLKKWSQGDPIGTWQRYSEWLVVERLGGEFDGEEGEREELGHAE